MSDPHEDGRLWAALPVPAVIVGAEGRIERANPAAETFLNRSARHLVGLPLGAAFDIEADLGKAMARVRESRADVLVADVPVGARGRPAVRGDVKFAPMDPRRPEDGLLVLISLGEMAAQAGRRSAGAGRSAIGMAEMLAHEIKNPLAGITGAAQLLAMSLREEDREMTDLIVAESRRIVALLDQVEQFGNLRPPERRAVNLHDVLDRAKRSARVSFGAHMDWSEVYDPSLPPAAGDADQLLQVVLNLVRNAAEACPRGGRIVLRTHYDGALRVRREDGAPAALPLQVEVIDDGPGFPDALREQAFDPFVSGRENGTGLGLALVAKIVADHGGWVTLDSAPGRTRVRVSLPVHRQGDG